MNKIPYQIDHSVFKWNRCFRFAFVCIDSLWWFDFDTLKSYKANHKFNVEIQLCMDIPDQIDKQLDRQIDRQSDYSILITRKLQTVYFNIGLLWACVCVCAWETQNWIYFIPNFLRTCAFSPPSSSPTIRIHCFAIEISGAKTTLSVWLIRFFFVVCARYARYTQ